MTLSPDLVIDLFAGPGGWDVAASALGLPVVGIEKDASACATRAAAGHLTIRADVECYPIGHLVGKVRGLIASPPCPTFSAAGDGTGRDEMPQLFRAATIIKEKGWTNPWLLHHWADPRTPLVLQPLRWVEALRPEWVALEQVPAVAPLWEHYERIWRDAGYSAWSGILNAADYGVPQTRQRAILIASRVRPASPPMPTHCKGGEESLFGSLLPWVSMVDALGWGATEQPCVTVTAGGCDTGGPAPLAHPNRFRERERERVGYRRTRGAGMLERHGDRPDTPVTEPAPTLTSKARSDVWVVDRRTNSKAAGGGYGADRPSADG